MLGHYIVKMYPFLRSTSCYFRLSFIFFFFFFFLAISSFTYYVLTLLLPSLPYPIYSVPLFKISSYSVSVIYASALKHRCLSLHPRKKYCVFLHSLFCLHSFSFFILISSPIYLITSLIHVSFLISSPFPYFSY